MNTAAIVELIHTLTMVAWVVTLPFLFWHRWPKLSIIVAVYNLGFIIVNRMSHWFLGECILTRAARWFGGDQGDEWFAVKFSRVVFGLIPSNKQVTYVEQVLVALVAIGVILVLLRRCREH